MQSKPEANATLRDLRRAISPQAWLASRARNALRRPAFIGAVSVGTFVTALVSLIVTPRSQKPELVVPTVARPDTLTVAAKSALARVELASAESTLVASRAAIAAALAAQVVPDTTAAVDPAQRDSLDARIRALSGLLTRAEQAPLPSSYKALAAAPELREDPRVPALLDSLSEVEREREGFGAVGGVDPIFVALTTRAREIGRAMQTIAEERRTAMQSQLAAMSPAVPEVPIAAVEDTTAKLAVRDSVHAVLAGAESELARLRAATRAADLEEERARARASAVAPPLALLASAFVLSAVLGFGVAFIGEVRRPRVTDAVELERYLGVRVLSTVETPTPSVERGRRQSDRAAPPYFDPGSEGYQLAYLGLATQHPTVLMATVTGDDPAIAAVVACNLSAIAADEARNTLVVDLESSCAASAALRARVEPGITDIVQGRATWPDATVAASVGRQRTVDLVPYGASAPRATTEAIIALLKQDTARLVRYYDAVILAAAMGDVAAGLAAALPVPGVVICAQPGFTPLRHLRDRIEEMRAAGCVIRGIVLWQAEHPQLPSAQELAARPRPKRQRTRPDAVASPV